ncbi:putative transcriptional regulator, TetR family [Nocardia nova SH22a]|uniref:Putative transcriptional regulator, TetR family n=1 Tax=Nocardia nova SH22a TaxID=1415166 RepID=W5TF82_9NOCA|nr:TetR/AcrR family transcriptional regulator [Nocardia nova]AHH18005.1 putative transcriptional regulator, TetR family [Nocardia nova SH22a]
MPRLTEERRIARRDQLLAAAVRCVAREGFHKTTMAAVIAESGMSAGAVYGYFKSKNDIIRAISESVLGRMTANLARLADAETAVAPIDALESVLEQVRDLARDGDGDIPRVAVQAWAEAGRDEAVAEIVRERIDQVRRAWLELLERARAAGTVAPGADLDAVAQVMLGATMGFVQQYLLMGDVEPHTYAGGYRSLFMTPGS